MIIFLIKLIAAPLLLALATLAARRWGTVLGGILIGLPLISAGSLRCGRHRPFALVHARSSQRSRETPSAET